jgi:hypothetical protein
MTVRRDFKKLVRAHAKATGKSYMQALLDFKTDGSLRSPPTSPDPVRSPPKPKGAA